MITYDMQTDGCFVGCPDTFSEDELFHGLSDEERSRLIDTLLDGVDALMREHPWFIARDHQHEVSAYWAEKEAHALALEAYPAVYIAEGEEA